MIFMRLGKQKRKFILTIRLKKIIYADLLALENDCYFKICAKRGNNNIQFIAQIYKRKDIKCTKQQHKIALTMYYDSSDKKYLQKQMTIKGYIMNNMQQIQKQLGSIDLNLSQYIDQTGQKMQISFSLYDSYKKQSLVSIYLKFQRQDDQNKSIQSSQTQTIKSNNQKKTNITTKITKNGVNNSEKSSQYNKFQQTDKNGTQRSSATKVNDQNSRNRSKQPIIKPITKKQSSFLFLNSNSQTNQTSIQYDPLQSTPKKGYNYNDNKPKIYQNTSNDSVDTKLNGNYKSNRQPNIPKFKPKNVNQPPKQQESQQLKSYILQRNLKEKQKQLQKAKLEIKDQRILINTLLQQKNKALGSYEVKKFNQQIQSLKKQLLQSNIRISELQTLNRSYEQNHQQNLSLIDKTSKQLIYYKKLAEHQKMKMAKIMQKCFQQGDNDLIQFMEENILDENCD